MKYHLLMDNSSFHLDFVVFMINSSFHLNFVIFMTNSTCTFILNLVVFLLVGKTSIVFKILSQSLIFSKF
ncbi:hypothetical protein Lalb_Chr17g0344011 [Lupinus albus]|uniref:Uncharacterized protein n=1 Tax=Lupinus albus TaxID=3870 RepID=A0A6A4NQE6_LUPAL|nr:hypothetical protein Lalb_Chr17g0344011 [Lupinus albus]